MRISRLEPGVVDVDTPGYGEFPNSPTFRVTGTEEVSAMGIV